MSALDYARAAHPVGRIPRGPFLWAEGTFLPYIQYDRVFARRLGRHRWIGRANIQTLRATATT